MHKICSLDFTTSPTCFATSQVPSSGSALEMGPFRGLFHLLLLKAKDAFRYSRPNTGDNFTKNKDVRFNGACERIENFGACGTWAEMR